MKWSPAVWKKKGSMDWCPQMDQFQPILPWKACTVSPQLNAEWSGFIPTLCWLAHTPSYHTVELLFVARVDNVGEKTTAPEHSSYCCVSVCVSSCSWKTSLRGSRWLKASVRCEPTCRGCVRGTSSARTSKESWVGFSEFVTAAENILLSRWAELHNPMTVGKCHRVVRRSSLQYSFILQSLFSRLHLNIYKNSSSFFFVFLLIMCVCALQAGEQELRGGAGKDEVRCRRNSAGAPRETGSGHDWHYSAASLAERAGQRAARLAKWTGNTTADVWHLNSILFSVDVLD